MHRSEGIMKLRLAFLIAIVCAFSTGAYATPPANPGFETGTLPPWTGVGVTSVGGTFGTEAPEEGNFQAVIQTTDNLTVSQTSLEGFLGLQAGSLTGFNSSPGGISGNAGGSAIKQIAINLQVGDVITFWWNFLPVGSPSSAAQNDIAFYTLHLDGSTGTAANVFALSSSTLSGGSTTGYQQRISAPVAQAGTYLIGFGVFDNYDNGGNQLRPDLLIDAVIPEPSSFCLFALGLAAAGAFSWRKRTV